MVDFSDSVRRQATDPLLVYDMKTNLPIGQVINMSYRGIRLMSEQPVEVSKVYYCRMPLPEKLLGRDEIFFDAECRWCKLNEETTWYDSGYNLRKPTEEDGDIIKLLTHKWMIDHSEKLNGFKKRPNERRSGLLSRIFGACFK